MLLVMSDEVESFNELERSHRASVQSYVLKRTGSVYLSEEITQETFAKAWNAREILQSHENPKAWLFTVARNLIIDQYRKSVKLTSVISRAGVLGVFSTEEVISGYESRENLEELLSLLSQDHRNVLQCCVIEGYNTQEAAEILRIPVGTVKSRLFYALKDLRLRLTGKEESNEHE